MNDEPINEEQLERLRRIMELPLEEAVELTEDELDNDDMCLSE